MERVTVLRVAAWATAGAFILLAAPSYAGDEAKTAELLVKVLKAGRTVVAEHQDLINDAGKGDKGFTPAYFEGKWAEKYKEVNKSELKQAAASSPAVATLIEIGKDTVAEAQPIINKQGMAFKGFLPALWGRKTGDKFSQKTGIRLKQTAEQYRFAGNKPDDYEMGVLKQFADPSYPKGKEVVKTVSMEGKEMLRYMAPEYAGKACLKCHGEPKGEKDITGGKKEGYKEGGLAGAISVTVPVK
jgi:general secretion pathway protein A